MKSMKNLKMALLAASSAAGFFSVTHAYAQLASESSGQIEEVTVTAQRRSENIQKVPIAIAAITPEMAVKMGALKTDQLAATVPGLVFGHEINSATAFIRGIGPNSNGTGEESSVAVYLDDLYIEQGNAAIFQLNDIDNIQVLKGPQGTLFGRNATGGVIQVNTRNPDSTPEFDAQIGYGNYNTFTANGYISGGLTDNLSSNLAIYGTNQADGWGRDVVTGAKAFTEEDWGIRNKWLWTPTSTTRILLSAGHTYTRGEEGLGFNQIPGFVAAGGHGFCLGGAGAPTFACPPGLPGATYVGWYNTQDAVNDVAVNKHDTVELRVDQDLSFAKAVSITGWQKMTGFAQFNQDGSPYADVFTKLYQTGRDVSQEFQLLNPDSAGYASWLTWIVGGFFMSDHSGYSNAQLQGFSFGLPIQYVPPSYYIDLTDNVTTTSYAGYAQGTAEVFPDTHLTLGIRYTQDHRVFSGGIALSPALGGTVLNYTSPNAPGAQKTWDMPTYRASLDHEFTDDIMGYVSFNRGEKSGQYDTFGTAAAGPIANPPVNPEILKAYEIGVKSEFLNNTLQLNAAAFHYDISNLQFAEIVAGGTKLLNAAAATENGGELTFDAIVAKNLTVSGGLSVLYGHYTSFTNAPDYFVGSPFAGPCPANGPDSCNAAGADMIRAPHYSTNLNADYVVPTPQGDFDLNANWSYTDTFQWFPDGSLQQPAVNLINTSVLWTEPGGKIDIRLWASNVNGAKYYSFGSESIGFGKQFSSAAPRTYGITLGVHD
jgi:iron complex outermembrane receptor protein